MREGFRQELKELKAEVVAIGRRCVDQTELGVRALVEGDADLAAKVITGDDEIDGRTLAVEEHALEVMATQFPVARDLRLLHSLT
jgi:phosphate transport system protein